MNSIPEDISWRSHLKHNRWLLIVGVLFIFGGGWMDIQWIPYHPSGILYLINLLPGILLLSAWYLASKYQKKRWTITIVGVSIFLVITFFTVYLNLGAGAFAAATTPITDIAQYDEIRKQLGNSELTQHFPLLIPENAEDVRFEYLPKFLQGGGHVQLRMKLPQSEISDLLAEFLPHAKYKFIGGDSSDHSNMLGGVPTTYFYTSGTDDHTFHDNYEILVLNAQDGGTPGSEWNHGDSYGIVISLEKSEIIYWAEYW